VFLGKAKRKKTREGKGNKTLSAFQGKATSIKGEKEPKARHSRFIIRENGRKSRGKGVGLRECSPEFFGKLFPAKKGG